MTDRDIIEAARRDAKRITKLRAWIRERIARSAVHEDRYGSAGAAPAIAERETLLTVLRILDGAS